MDMENDNFDATMCKRASEESLYSDEDPSPNRITRRKRKPVNENGETICAPRLQSIAEPDTKTYEHLYRTYAYVMEPERASRIRRKLDDINQMTLEELEAEINRRTTSANVNHRQTKQEQIKSFQEFSQKMIDQLFDVFAVQFNKQIQKRKKQPICVTEATNRLIEYCQEIVESAVPKNRPRRPRGSVSFKHSEQTAKKLVAQVLALIAKRVYMDTAKSCTRQP